MVRKDTAAVPTGASQSAVVAGRVAQTAEPEKLEQQAFPVVSPSTVVNIALHSLLMITVPFALFFIAHFGGFDTLLSLTSGSVPSKETKTYLGAGLAVLGVNLVIASFVVAAFREQPAAPSSKKDD